MQLRVVGVGRVRESFLNDGIQEYRVRISPYFHVELADVREGRHPRDPSPATRAGVLKEEGERLLSAARGSGVLVLLDIRGESWSSEDLAARLSSWVLEGHSTVSFLIGGPFGVSEEVKNEATHVLSLSRMTYPHQMVRLILLEQLYRAARIHRGDPYHK
ncbi:MAG TPA: 23S rRNA (pseudouridine(1915)-N(3))-methyltransferase RlmH [Methanolinea sp.]|jgi:23S rRNA (pseudouridine1915-N3)-methyltransferase|nr:MAG: rRNA large subunit methyltransferase [Methanoregulaceae archaeon PtaB.Bin009]OPY41745.1 MAG: rRNA large subunit methyltransferase [Methanoregulaceae archaeon PtaU1.Bin066]HII76493.1 23S rRNA (pseudouridine(1915)-N(3))-methyltransferase RlmH [Methanolinea sp.]